MLIDLTLKVNADQYEEITSHQNIAALGHLGTHFDAMGKEFSLANFRRQGKLVNVSAIGDRDIGIADFKDSTIVEKDFVLFYTGFIDRISYGSQEYFKAHPQLSMEAVDYLIQKKISMIGVDATGLRRGSEHPKMDQHCADHDVFVVENLVSLGELWRRSSGRAITLYTLPANIAGLTGLPCRVVAEF
jgi:kynurenine formamidase